MYAVIETGGKQYRVEPGDVIDIERLPDAATEDEKVAFDRVLMVGGDDGVQVGDPVVDGAVVEGVPVAEVRGRKVMVFKFKRRKGYRRRRGHRQDLLRVRIDDIKAEPAKSAKAESKKAAPKKAAPKKAQAEKAQPEKAKAEKSQPEKSQPEEGAGEAE